MKFFVYIFAFAIDFAIANAIIGISYYEQLNYDTTFLVGYAMIFYGLTCYIGCRDTMGTHLVRYHNMLRK